MPSEQRIKQAIYRSWHRGCKETDILLGDFARANLFSFNDEKFALYEEFIAENDWDLCSLRYQIVYWDFEFLGMLFRSGKYPAALDL